MKPLTPFVLILSMGISLSLDQGAAQAQHADMVRYRARLAALARSEHVVVSRAGGPVKSVC